MPLAFITENGYLETISLVLTSLFGILGWILRYLFMKVLPRQTEHFKEALARQQDTFERVLTGQADLFRSGLQSLNARQRRSSENIGKLAEQLRGHEQREELQLETQTGHLAGIRESLERLEKK